MLSSIYQIKNYKVYIKQWLARPDRARGERTRIAEALGCHTAYISQVLNADAHFSLEQVEQLNRFLGHTPDESHFLFLLVQFARAGTPQLKDYFREQIDRVNDDRMILKNRLDVKGTLDKEEQMIFYGSWYYGAVHVLISVPSFQTKENLAEVLHLPIEKVAEILSFLEKIGLAIQDGTRWKMGSSHIFIDSTSPMINRHHINWRIQAISSLDSLSNEDLHYSAPISLSRDDFFKIREILIETINRAREIVRPSREEIAVCYCIDLFKIGR